MQFEQILAVLPSMRRMATAAFRAELVPVNIGVAVCAFHPYVSELKVAVAINAINCFMRPDQGETGG